MDLIMDSTHDKRRKPINEKHWKAMMTNEWFRKWEFRRFVAWLRETDMRACQSAEDGRITEELPGARLFQIPGTGCRQLKSAPGVHCKLSHLGCKTSCRSISGCIIMSKNLTRNNLPTKLGCTLHIQIVTVIYLEVLFTRYRLHVTRYKQFLFFQLRFECCLIFLKKQPRFLLACCYPEPTAE